jgi:hypothetical protein
MNLSYEESRQDHRCRSLSSFADASAHAPGRPWRRRLGPCHRRAALVCKGPYGTFVGRRCLDLSAKRDGFRLPQTIQSHEQLIEPVDRLNSEWVLAAGRMSPRLLRELLAFSGPEVEACFAALDPMEMGGPVSWADPNQHQYGLISPVNLRSGGTTSNRFGTLPAAALRPVLSLASAGCIRASIAVRVPQFQRTRRNIREARDCRGGGWSLVCVQGRRSLDPHSRCDPQTSYERGTPSGFGPGVFSQRH